MNLITYNNVIFIIGTVTRGVYPEADGSRELYKIVNNDGTFYAVTEGFIPHTIENIPSEVKPNAWCYTEEDGFYLNPDYNEMDEMYSREYQEGYQQALLDMTEVE